MSRKSRSLIWISRGDMRMIGPMRHLDQFNTNRLPSVPTILLMELLNLPYVLAGLDHIVVTFVPRGQSRECGAGNAGNWTEEYSV